MSEKQVLEEISKISSATTLSLGMQPKALAKAVYQAKALGLEMAQIESIASSLLDFESSIQNELEAELLTGKNLNLEKARLAALNGDIATVAEENAKQTADARFGFNPFELVEFNRFQPSGFKDMAIQLYEERFGSDQPKDYELLLKIAKKLKERRKYAKYIGADDFFATK